MNTALRNPAAGLTMIEVLVAIVILAVVSVAIVGLLPGITRTTAAGSEDVVQTQRMASVLERVGDAWMDGTAFEGGVVDGQLVAAFATAALGDSCTATSPGPVDGLRTVVVTCEPVGSLPAQELRQVFGDPR